MADGNRIVEANDSFLQMIGHGRHELEEGQLRWVDLTPPEWAARDELALAEIAERGYCRPFEKEYMRKDGTRVPILLGAAAIQGAEPPWICGVVDLTAQRAAEQDRVAFVDSATHDLKNPLTSLTVQVQLLLRRIRRNQTLDLADVEASLAAIEGHGRQMVALLDELMDVARMRAGELLHLNRGPVDLVELARECVAEARHRTTGRIIVETDEAELVGNWDRRRLERVVQNLLDNAIKYSPPDAEIVVRVSCEERYDGADCALFSGQDQGVGIPAADLPHVFERFRRGANVAGIAGTGIGLTGARQIIEQHGGAITVESVETVGSTFTLRLPIEPK